MSFLLCSAIASHDSRMPIAQRIHADAAQQVEIAIALLVDQVHALAADKQDRIALVRSEQQLCFCGLHGRQLSGCEFQCRHSATGAHATSTSVP